MAGVQEESSASDPTLEEGCPGFPLDRAGCGHTGICLQPAGASGVCPGGLFRGGTVACRSAPSPGALKYRSPSDRIIPTGTLLPPGQQTLHQKSPRVPARQEYPGKSGGIPEGHVRRTTLRRWLPGECVRQRPVPGCPGFPLELPVSVTPPPPRGS